MTTGDADQVAAPSSTPVAPATSDALATTTSSPSTTTDVPLEPTSSRPADTTAVAKAVATTPAAPPTTTPAAADPCALLTAEEVSLTTEGTFTARQDEVFGFAQCWFRGGPIDDLVRLSVRQIDPAALEAVRDEFLTATMGTAASRRRSPSGMSAHARSS